MQSRRRRRLMMYHLRIYMAAGLPLLLSRQVAENTFLFVVTYEKK